MGAIKLELRSPHNVNGIAADPQPDWSFDNLLSELDSIERKRNMTLDNCVPFAKKQPRNFRTSKENFRRNRGFVMHVSDHELDFSDSDTEDEVDDSSMLPGRRFAFDDLYLSDGSEPEIPVDTQGHLMDKVGSAEGALHELTNELQLCISEEVRNKISILEANLVNENENFTYQIAKIGKYRKTQQERERKIDLQYQRTIAEALDNHLTAVQRDHEHISQLEEKRIRDDAAREEAKRKEKALMEEKIRQERVKAEEERLQAERAEMAKAAAEAEKQAAEEAASKRTAQILRDSVHKAVDHSKETLGHPVVSGFDNKEEVKLSERNVIRASENALELEKRRLQIHKELHAQNEALKASSSQVYRRHGQNFNRLIKTISASIENVRTRADELVNLIGSPECPQSISIQAFAEKVVSNCENSQKSNGYIFACSRVIVIVTSKIPMAMNILIAELNRACMYTVPKYIDYSQILFETKEAYFKAIGYKELDGKIESTDSYVERLSSYMKLYGALVQTEVEGFQNLHGLKEGWAWLARFLNSLPANLYTAVALQHFLEMSGFSLYRRYRNQFEKLLRIIARDFLNALKEGNSDSVNAKLIKVRTSILNYIESNQFKKVPEGLQLRGHLNSNDFFLYCLARNLLVCFSSCYPCWMTKTQRSVVTKLLLPTLFLLNMM